MARNLDNKVTSSFVTPTYGSPNSLTLTTYVTDAADLHYAVVPSGAPPLDAKAIKNAVEQCSAIPYATSAAPANNGPIDLHHQRRVGYRENAVPVTEKNPTVAWNPVAASTISVPRAQKAESIVVGLAANTSYDVYFVAEVIGSNGVFGPVQSVLQSKTHPEAPLLKLTSIQPSNSSAQSVELNGTSSSPGIIHIAFLPSSMDSSWLNAKDIAENRQFLDMPSIVYSTYEEKEWTELLFYKVVSGLNPSTLYDVLIVAEALGGGGVRSGITHEPKAFRTHSVPPDVSHVTCLPRDGSAFEVEVQFKLDYDLQELNRVTEETLPYFSYTMHYMATRLEQRHDKAHVPTNKSLDLEPKANDSLTMVRGHFMFGDFSTIEELHQSLDRTHKSKIDDLQNGTIYQVELVAETATSIGLFGKSRSSLPCRTHDVAPVIIDASANATNGTVNALTVMVEMTHPGNIHYLVGDRGKLASVRGLREQAANMSHLKSLINSERATVDIITGVLEFDAQFSADAHPNASGHYTKLFQIDGLTDDTVYSILLLSETTNSNGVFGQIFDKPLEVNTNENASEVFLTSIEPVFGSTTQVEFNVEMTKQDDFLYYCIGMDNSTLALGLQKCHEVEKSALRASHSSRIITFEVGNLTEDTMYFAAVYAENAKRNGVFSAKTPLVRVKTHNTAPRILNAKAQATPASTDQIEVDLTLSGKSLVHYAVEEVVSTHILDGNSSAEALSRVPDVQELVKSANRNRHHSVYLQNKCIFTELPQTKLQLTNLKENTTYNVYVVSETSRNGSESGVYGEVILLNATTHALAPKIVKATIDPISATTDSVVITANISSPGIVHYFLSDIDFADPAVIKPHPELHYSPHVVRGEFYVHDYDIAMESINGTNESKPMEPLMFVNNKTISRLKRGTTYHVSLTTETYDSNGVFGEFPPPILVTTHFGPPQILPDTLVVQAKEDTSSSITIKFRLSRFGEVHYAVFFRGLVPDRSSAVISERKQIDDLNIQEENDKAKAEAIAAGTYNASNWTDPKPIHKWPPAISEYDLMKLNASVLKSARLEELGVGVWENGTITVSRDDVLKGELTTKEVKNLPPNALFDVCLVSETATSDGIFDWIDSYHGCHQVKTHADYTNQSILLDEINVQALDGVTDAIRLRLSMSKLLTAPAYSNKDLSYDRLTTTTGRIPYFVLVDGHEGRKEFTHNSFSHHSRSSHALSGFKHATLGRGNVVAAGMLSNIVSENESFVILEHEIHRLDANHRYFLFFAYETSGSEGVYTEVNPHKHRSNDTKSKFDGIEVTTHERAPQISKPEATPTFGNTTRITVKFDLACAACSEAIVYMFVYPESCPSPALTFLFINSTDFAVQENSSLATDCNIPLARRKFIIEMTEKQRSKTTVEEDVVENLSPNTTYKVLLATETANSNGVISEQFEEMSVTTHASAPKFSYVYVSPRKGSTTELLLEFELERPGQVHFMCGKSGNSEFKVTSAYNISSRRLSGHNAPNYHNYPREVVRLRRSIDHVRNGEKYLEVLDYLEPGTSYDLYVVVESTGDSDIYGDIRAFQGISTFSNAPILLAHSVYPTHGSVSSLTVGFRIDAPGLVHFSAVGTNYWGLTQHVARTSTIYGNRLAMEDRLVSQGSIEIEEKSMHATGPGSRDSGWQEVTIDVPQPGTNYTVFIVTETKDSDGIYGIVATHPDVQSYNLAPDIKDVAVTAADARVDALNVSVQLSAEGHVHYAVVPHDQHINPTIEATSVATGMAIVNESLRIASQHYTEDNANKWSFTTFIVENLQGGTTYDLYFRPETLNSFGVFGPWTTVPISARTHGLPPEVLEDLACDVTPPCAAIGRETCTQKPNVCGECLSGFQGAIGSSNEACHKVVTQTTEVKPQGAKKIKISGVRKNLVVDQTEASKQPLQQNPIPLTQNVIANGIAPELESALRQDTDATWQSMVENPLHGLVTSSSTSTIGATLCPPNAQLIEDSGECECLPVFQPDETGTACVFTDMTATTSFGLGSPSHHSQPIST